MQSERFEYFTNQLAIGFAEHVLENAYKYKWKRHGIGFMKTNVTKDIRLHIWHHELRQPGVTTMHSHPWDFDSLIYRGRLTNKIFQTAKSSDYAFPMIRQNIDCDSGRLIGSPVRNPMQLVAEHTYVAGQMYHQDWYVAHRSLAIDGTVTLIRKSKPQDNLPNPSVFWHEDDAWGDADQREPTDWEFRCALGATKL